MNNEKLSARFGGVFNHEGAQRSFTKEHKGFNNIFIL